ncbi:MAG: hypothetical protein V1708_04000 [Candidatus Micrarchaeota archaeon]
MPRREEVLLSLLEEGASSQLELSTRLKISLSAVNCAVKPLAAMGAVEIRLRGLKLIDLRKAALYYATHCNLEKKTVYSTRAEKQVTQIEREMPQGAAFTAYSGYRMAFDDTPADYSEVLVYADDAAAAEIQRRFPARKGRPNVIVLRPDSVVGRLSKKGVAPKYAIFSDLWNLKGWYAAEFLKAIEARLFGTILE